MGISEALDYTEYFLDIALCLRLGSYPKFELTFDFHGGTACALLVLDDNQELDEGWHDEGLDSISIYQKISKMKNDLPLK